MKNSEISWCHNTFSPWIGCTQISDGCRNCYAKSIAERFYKDVEWGKKYRRTSVNYWKQPLAWDKKAEKIGVRYRVFPSMCDPFDDEAPIEWLCDFFELIKKTQNLFWLNLTKRPENIRQRIRLVMQFLDKATKREDNKKYETSTQRRECSQTHFNKRTRNRQNGENLENQKEDIRQGIEGSECNSMQTSKGRIESCIRIPTSESNDEQKKILCGGSSSNLVSFQGTHTRRIDNQPQERNQIRQSVGKFRDSNIQPTEASCHPKTWSETSRCKGRKSSENKTKRSRCYGNEKKAEIRRDGKNDCTRLQYGQEGCECNNDRTNMEALALFSWCNEWLNGNPPSNVWLGVTCENQKSVDERVSILLSIPATVKFISAEPLLEEITFEDYPIDKEARDFHGDYSLLDDIDWLICGCESGRSKRPCDWSWAIKLRNECIATKTKFFLKQMPNINGYVEKEPRIEGRQWLEIP